MVQNMSCKIYMDHAATTEMLPQVRKAMEPYLMEEYGNASTSYEMGRRTREALEGAREQIAMLIKAKPEEIFLKEKPSGCPEFGDVMSLEDRGVQYAALDIG